MVLRKRPIKKEEVVEKDDTNVDEDKPVETRTSEETKFGFIKPTIDKLKNFHDQACMVLDILESQGINIYDSNRYPGMYLRRDNTTPPVNLKEKIMKAKQQVEPVENNTPSPSSKVIEMLKNKNKK